LQFGGCLESINLDLFRLISELGFNLIILTECGNTLNINAHVIELSVN